MPERIECEIPVLQKERYINTLTFTLVNPLESRGNYSATSNNMKLVHWPLMGGLLYLVQRAERGPSSLYQM